jgi:O-glycosyl hydrolase
MHTQRMSAHSTLAKLASVASLIVLSMVGFGATAAEPRANAHGASGQTNSLVVTGVRRQRIDYWGSALVTDTEPLINGSDLSPAMRTKLYSLLFRDLRENLVRVFVGGFGAAAAPPPADRSAGAMARRAAFIRAARAYGVKVMLTGADAPAAWKTGNRLRDGMERQYGDHLIDWSERLRQLGAPADYLAVGNEVSNRDFFNMSDTQAAAAFEQMARRIHDGRLRIRLVAGDNENFADAYRYSALELASPLSARYTVAGASHAYSYWGSSSRDAQAMFARLIRGQRLRVWMTEHLPQTSAPGACGSSGALEDTINSALSVADDITTLMSGPAQPSAYLTLRAVARDHGPGIASIVLEPPTRNCSAPTPAESFSLTKRFYAEKQYTRAAPRGSFRLALESVPPGLKAIAFHAPDRSTRIVVLNESDQDRRIVLNLGRRGSGKLSGRRTSATENYAPLKVAHYRGRPRTIRIQALSITTFVFAPPTLN